MNSYGNKIFKAGHNFLQYSKSTYNILDYNLYIAFSDIANISLGFCHLFAEIEKDQCLTGIV